MNEYIIIPISLLIIFLSIVIYIHNRKENKNILFHSVFLIIYAIWAMALSLLNFGGPVWLFAVLLNNFAPLYYLSPVFFYFFVRSVFTDSVRFKKTDIIHFIPFLINFIAVVPYLLTSFNYKLEIAARLMQNLGEFSRFNFGLFYPAYINQIARPVLFLFYLTLSSLAIRKFQLQNKSSLDNLKPQSLFMIRTLSIEIAVFSFFSIAQLVVRINSLVGVELATITVQQNILLFTSSVLYLAIPIYILLNPRYMYGLPPSDNSERMNVTGLYAVTENGNDTGKSKIKPEILQENEIFSKLSEKILEYFSAEKPYLNDKFSVNDICINLNVPRHRVQYCFNVILGKSFTELKNEMRIAYAMELIINNKSNNLTLEGIGKQAGFASNSNFYRSFREVNGMTPNKWMEQEAASQLPENGRLTDNILIPEV